MKSYSMICFFLSLAMILCPLVSVENVTSIIYAEQTEEQTTLPQPEKEVTAVKVMNADSKNITEMSLEDYLVGVIAEEMNASYNEEAIKAQAVAAHTMLLYSKEHKNQGLNGADITDSPATHQGFLTPAEQQKKWGKSYEKNYNKIKSCVAEVLDYVIFYDSQPINAVFHSTSNGKTENASDVWGGNYAYLISVDSSGDLKSPEYDSTAEFTESEFKKALENEGVKLQKSSDEWVGEITNTDTGMVESIVLGDKTFKGTEVRKIFSLKSSTFSIEHKDDKFIFKVKGYGHGVGLSQYGSNYLANEGYSYKEILAHYYPNTTIEKI